MRQLKEDQWYCLPSGQWCRAVYVDDPQGPILMVYGTDLSSSDGYKNTFDLYIDPDGRLTATGSATWDTWTLTDLREATPDESETQTLRLLGGLRGSIV